MKTASTEVTVHSNRSLRSAEYASAAEFCAIFQSEMASLYSLALWLTADAGKAEACFLAALDDCRKEHGVFREFAGSWSRLAIVERAIRMIQPVPGKHADFEFRDPQVQRRDLPPHARKVMELSPFERFVYVLCVLEGYSSRRCAIRLKCTFAEVEAAKQRAFQSFGAAAQSIVAAPELALAV
jgi:hypothetical protein